MASVTIPASRGSARAGKPTLVARYRSLGDARDAIERLESHGIDGDDLAIVGDAALELQDIRDRRRTDHRFLSRVSSAIVLGVLAGAAAGALIGAAFVGVAIAIWTPAASPGWVFGLVTAWFAAGGAVLGAFAAVSRHIGFSESWPLTLEDEPAAPLLLAIYADEADLRGVVGETHPLEIVLDEEAGLGTLTRRAE